jgi:hypothetical protein
VPIAEEENESNQSQRSLGAKAEAALAVAGIWERNG